MQCKRGLYLRRQVTRRIAPCIASIADPFNISVPEHIDDRLPVWPADMSSILYGRVNNPEWMLPWMESWNLHTLYGYPAAFVYGRQEPLTHLQALNKIYVALSDGKIPDVRKRAEAGLRAMEESGISPTILQNLSLGVSAPLREALRTAQLSPGGDWSVPIYRLIGRNDLAEGFSSNPAVFANSGYRPVREILVSTLDLRSSHRMCLMSSV